MTNLEDFVEIDAFLGNGKVLVGREDYELIDLVDFYATSLNSELSSKRDVSLQIEKLKKTYGLKGFDFKLDEKANRVRIFFRGIVGGKDRYFADWIHLGQDDGVVKEIYYNYLAHRAELNTLSG